MNFATIQFVLKKFKELRNIIPSKTSELTNDSGFITSDDIPQSQVPDLSSYATQAYVRNYAQPKGNYLTGVPSEYITETELNEKGYLTQHQSLSGYAKTADHYTKTESDNKYQPKGNYLTSHQDISGKANKSDAETWTFTLENGSTVTKKVVLA